LEEAGAKEKFATGAAGVRTGIKGGGTGVEGCDARTLLDAKKLGTLLALVVSAVDPGELSFFKVLGVPRSEDPEEGPKSVDPRGGCFSEGVLETVD
jgi:hypothetical protein